MGASSSSSCPQPTLNPYLGFFLSSENLAKLAIIVVDIINDAKNKIEPLESNLLTQRPRVNVTEA